MAMQPREFDEFISKNERSFKSGKNHLLKNICFFKFWICNFHQLYLQLRKKKEYIFHCIVFFWNVDNSKHSLNIWPPFSDVSMIFLFGNFRQLHNFRSIFSVKESMARKHSFWTHYPGVVSSMNHRFLLVQILFVCSWSKSGVHSTFRSTLNLLRANNIEFMPKLIE